MPFWRKLIYFAIGVTMGVFLVKFLFGWRDDIQCNYFPNDRVLYDMRLKKMIFDPRALHQMQEANLDSNDFTMMLHTGKVDFDSSRTNMEDSCKTYLIHHTPKDDSNFSARFMNCDSTLKVMEVWLMN